MIIIKEMHSYAQEVNVHEEKDNNSHNFYFPAPQIITEEYSSDTNMKNLKEVEFQNMISKTFCTKVKFSIMS